MVSLAVSTNPGNLQPNRDSRDRRRVSGWPRLRRAIRSAAWPLVAMLLTGDAPMAQEAAVTILGPPPPVPPAVINRDETGRATVRATRLTSPLRIDGRLDEQVYEEVVSMSGFIQNDPAEGEPATQQTEVWLLFDDDAIYVIGKCWESNLERMIATEMRRDGAITQNDSFAWSFDTFYDHRNGVLFEVSPIGGRTDGQVTNERSVNTNWNPVWQVAVGRFEGGWTVEAALPFKSLRYRPGRTQVWGFQARRKNLWKNEISYLTPIPQEDLGQGHFRSSLHSTLVGLEIAGGSKNLELKPYATTDLTTDNVVRPRISNDLGGDAGVDVKYGVTQNLTADFTYNTDFAQVEADEQQVNLTRFNLFFPEKREFFLENQGTFTFGGTTDQNTPILFHSRTIGLNQGHEVPIVAGGRLTGRVDRFELGVLDIHTDEDEVAGLAPTNFQAARIKRDILRKSSVGAIFTGRSVSQRGGGPRQSYGVDTTLAFFTNLVIDGYWANTPRDDARGDTVSYRGRLDYAGDRYGVLLERLIIGADFFPEVGFVRATDMHRSFGQFRFSPRPKASTLVRKYSAIASFDYVENSSGRVDLRDQGGSFGIDFQNGDVLNVGYSNIYEFLPTPLTVAGVTVPIGAYDYASVSGGYTFGPQRRVASGTATLEYGSFYDGRKTTFTITRGRSNFPPHLSIEPSYSANWVSLPQGSYATHLVGSRITYMMTPLMFASALVQYNSLSQTVAANIRFRWEYQPGSELFVVFNEQRDSRASGFPELANRAFIVKINRRFAF
jgi:hypothetical protein